MAWSGERSLENASKSLPKTPSSLRALCYECNTQQRIPLLRVRIIVIHSAIIALGPRKNYYYYYKKQQGGQMVILQPADFVLQRCFLTLVLVFLVMNIPENDRYSS